MTFNRNKAMVLLFSALTLTACERIALMPRPDVDEQIERDSRRQNPLDADRRQPRDEIIGTVERVDRDRNEIQVRTTDAGVVVVKYDPATQVYDRERDVGIDALRLRDQVLVRVSTNSRGDQYADTIRLNDSRDRNY
jgi:hypothetical protein